VCCVLCVGSILSLKSVRCATSTNTKVHCTTSSNTKVHCTTSTNSKSVP
jgi:hypothetical protein